LGESKAPFFGVSQKRKKGERRERTPFFAVMIVDGVVVRRGRDGLWASATSLRRLGAGQCLGRLGGGRVRRRGGHKRRRGPTGAEARRTAVYATREGLVQYVREAEVASWTGPTC